MSKEGVLSMKGSSLVRLNGIAKLVYNIIKVLVMVIFLLPVFLVFLLVTQIKCKYNFRRGLIEAGIDKDTARQLIPAFPGIRSFINIRK
jgi:hypothetical protein